MRLFFVALFAQILTVSNLSAEPVTLKCTTSDGGKAADLIVDLDNKVMTWAAHPYDIYHVDDIYISAYERSNDVGGEVWVINRTTGQYKRAAVGIYCASDCGQGDGMVFGADTYEGRCVKQQF